MSPGLVDLHRQVLDLKHVQAQLGLDIRFNRCDLSIRDAHIGFLPELAARSMTSPFLIRMLPALPFLGWGQTSRVTTLPFDPAAGNPLRIGYGATLGYPDSSYTSLRSRMR